MSQVPIVRSRVLAPLMPLWVFSAAMCALFATWPGLAHLESAQRLNVEVLRVLLVTWIVLDAHARRRLPCYDLGFFCFLFFPFSVVWYCFHSRGWFGILMLGMFLLMCILPFIIAALRF